MRYGMVIDLNRCVGCRACQIACKAENFVVPGVFFNRVLFKEVGKYPSVKMEFLPVQCNQCKEAACVTVCPTGATSKSPEGIVSVDATKCIGCRYCMMACPYRQRFYRSLRPRVKSFFPFGTTSHERYGEQSRDYQKGTVIKCDFCLHRIQEGKEPACVATCPAIARHFGDLDDPESEVSQLIARRGGYQLLPHMGTDPSVYYVR